MMQYQITKSYIFNSLLNSYSQVILLSNWKAGLFILLGILAVSWKLALISLIGAIVANSIGLYLTNDRSFIKDGLMGYNAVLTSLAVPLFLEGNYVWLLALFGAALTTTVAISFKKYFVNIPMLTFPFILTTWLIFLLPYQLEIFQLSDQLMPQSLLNWQPAPESDITWLGAFFNSISQIFLLDSALTGILILIGIFIASKRAFLSSVLAIIIALFFSYILGVENGQIQLGMYGYNAILTAIAVCYTFNVKHSGFSILYGLIGAVITVPVTAGLSTIITPYGLPFLTMPFVLTTWLMLSSSSKEYVSEESVA